MKITKLMMLAVAGVYLTLCAGCGTTGPAMDVNKLGMAYYSQPNNTELVSIKGSNLSVSITGASEIKLSTAVPPKSIIPRDPSFLQTAIPALVQGAVAGVGIYTAGKVMETMAAQPRTVDPLVVHPQVVEPEVIFAP